MLRGTLRLPPAKPRGVAHYTFRTLSCYRLLEYDTDGILSGSDPTTKSY
eukprot:COSAG06_NODE_58610_length_276_cov_1.124294_1_plen_48_part_01